MQATPSFRFSYVRYDERSMAKQGQLKRKFEELENLVDNLLPEGRPKSLCMTALEEAYMWCGKGIRDDQIARTGKVDEQPERGNE